MKRVLLINMPFRNIRHPAIGISLLKAELAEKDLPCDVRYFNFEFARMIGLENYETFEHLPLFGERLFARTCFGSAVPDNRKYLEYLIRNRYGTEECLSPLIELDRFVPPFLDHCLESVEWGHYDIVGFSVMFEQNLPSLALAKRIKDISPETTIIFGGANCEGEMGLELHRSFPVIDFICSGEGDESLPSLVRALRGSDAITGIPGIVIRDESGTHLTSPPEPVRDLDSLPYPDHSDYFTQMQIAGFSPSLCDEILMESSRGCWWGEKSQCTFCGLNGGGSIGYRSKSKDRAVKEIRHMVMTYAVPHGVTKLSMVDNVLDMDYFESVIPELARIKLPVTIFYETKANLNKNQLRMLAAAGIREIQPGIESLNSHVLTLMRKGVTALLNVRLLKHCQQLGIYPLWSILTRFPGEKAADYQEMVMLISRIVHLPPPAMQLPFGLQRFSPYFVNSESNGLLNVRPNDGYSFIYPFEEARIANLTYDFSFDFSPEASPPDCQEDLAKAVEFWQKAYMNGTRLDLKRNRNGTAIIRDGRSGAAYRQFQLDKLQSDLYALCDEIRSIPTILEQIRTRHSSIPIRERDVRDFLGMMTEYNFMACENDLYLSLAVPTNEDTRPV